MTGQYYYKTNKENEIKDWRKVKIKILNIFYSNL